MNHPIRSDTEIEVIEMDEMHSYIGNKKNYCWIWITVDRYGKRFIHFIIGDRSLTMGRHQRQKCK